VTAIDFTPAGVDLARRRFGLARVSPEEDRVDSALSLSVPDSMLDCVWSNGVLHAKGGTRRAVAEVRLVLKPGGRAIISHFYRRPSWMYLMNRLGRENIEYREEDPPVDEFLAGPQVEYLLHSVEILETHRSHPLCCIGFRAWLHTYLCKPICNLIPESIARRVAYMYTVTASAEPSAELKERERCSSSE
jgi:SAM-dependent methyltransferase